MSALAERGDDVAIWTRRPKEPLTAYLHFCAYRDMPPPRSMPKLAKALGRGVSTLWRWSTQWDWVERAEAYTDHLDRLTLEEHEDAIRRRRREENEQMYSLGKTLQVAAHARLTGLKDEDGQLVVEPIDPSTLDADEVARWADLGTKFVRLSMGLPTDFTGVIQVSMLDLQRILGAFIALAAERMTPEAHELLVRDCYAMVRESLGE